MEYSEGSSSQPNTALVRPVHHLGLCTVQLLYPRKAAILPYLFLLQDVSSPSNNAVITAVLHVVPDQASPAGQNKDTLVRRVCSIRTSVGHYTCQLVFAQETI